MLIRTGIFIAGVLSLAGCCPVPDGYIASPALTEYTSELMPTAQKNSVRTVSVCQDNVDAEWYSSILFSDGAIYHYALNRNGVAASQINFPSWSSRSLGIDPDYGCLGWVGTNYEFFARGSYRIEVSRFGLSAVVSKQIAEQVRFDSDVKARVRDAAVATQQAELKHKSYTPPASSWGIKACEYLPVPGSKEKPCNV